MYLSSYLTNMDLPPVTIHGSRSFSEYTSAETSLQRDNFLMSSRINFWKRSFSSRLILASSTSSTPSGTTSSASSSISSSSSVGYDRLTFRGLNFQHLHHISNVNNFRSNMKMTKFNTSKPLTPILLGKVEIHPIGIRTGNCCQYKIWILQVLGDRITIDCKSKSSMQLAI